MNESVLLNATILQEWRREEMDDLDTFIAQLKDTFRVSYFSNMRSEGNCVHLASYPKSNGNFSFFIVVYPFLMMDFRPTQTSETEELSFRISG